MNFHDIWCDSIEPGAGPCSNTALPLIQRFDSIGGNCRCNLRPDQEKIQRGQCAIMTGQVSVATGTGQFTCELASVKNRVGSEMIFQKFFRSNKAATDFQRYEPEFFDTRGVYPETRPDPEVDDRILDSRLNDHHNVEIHDYNSHRKVQAVHEPLTTLKALLLIKSNRLESDRELQKAMPLDIAG